MILETAAQPRYYTTTSSPIGELWLAGEGGALCALYMSEARERPSEFARLPRDDAALAPVTEQLARYFAGELTSFEVELAPSGTPFQRAVWDALTEIPYGETRSYGEIARRVGKPRAARAVGMANNANPIAVVVPCHRVVGADGSLTGYGGGLGRKRLLLDLERAA